MIQAREGRRLEDISGETDGILSCPATLSCQIRSDGVQKGRLVRIRGVVRIRSQHPGEWNKEAGREVQQQQSIYCSVSSLNHLNGKRGSTPKYLVSTY